MPLGERAGLYADVLKIVREAMQQECRIPPPKSIAEVLPYMAQFRQVARLFAIESAAYREKGDFTAAANSALDCMQMAQDAATHRTLIGCLVGIACEAIGRKALDETVPSLDAAGCNMAIARLGRIDAKRVPMREVLDGEERWQRIALKELAADPQRFVKELERSADERPPLDVAPASLARSWQALDDYSAKLRQLADQPYRARVKPLRSGDPLIDAIAPAMSGVWFKDAAVRADAGLRQTQIAARAQLLEKGALSPDLQTLVPAYLPKVPSDPFGDGPLHARMGVGMLLIYSIGPDGFDDGGRETTDSFLRLESSGDVVVKVPTQP